MLVVAAGLFAGGMRYPYAIVSLSFCFFVAATIALEFFRGANAIREKSGSGFIPSVIELTHRNTRRYGGYLVHMGIVLMFIGFSGAPFKREVVADIQKGHDLQVGAYTLRLLEIHQGDTPNYQWESALLGVSKGGDQLGTLEPARRYYKATGESNAEVALRTRLNEDLYINYSNRDGDTVTLQAYVSPLVTWIWVGAIVLICGTLIALVPSKVARSYARTEVIGTVKKDAVVQA